MERTGRGGCGWIREASPRERAFEAALKERAGFQEVEPGVLGGRPTWYWGEAGQVNCSKRVKGTGYWAEEFKLEFGSGKQPLKFRAGTD